MTLRVGTRGSALARWQTDHAVALLRSHDAAVAIAIEEYSSAGDDRPDEDLSRLEGIGFFSSTLEHALLERRIDLAVHSYKDLPVETTPGLVVAAIPERGPVEDALCARDGLRFADLPAGARIGTSSPRRTAQLRALRPDLDYLPLRGNVPTRLARVRHGGFDAVVLACAGLERLGLGDAITERFATARVLPAPAQGALALQCRAEDATVVRRLVALDHAPTRRAVEAERALLHALRGGCSVPVGALGRDEGGAITLDAGVFDPAGAGGARVTVNGTDPQATGHAAARLLIARGVHAILDALGREPRPLGRSGS